MPINLKTYLTDGSITLTFSIKDDITPYGKRLMLEYWTFQFLHAWLVRRALLARPALPPCDEFLGDTQTDGKKA